MDASLDFQVRVETQRRRFLREILPRYVHRYMRGRGHELVVRMLRAHDAKRLDPGGPQPSERALRLAEAAGSACPVLALGRLEADREAGVVLGRFVHHERYQSMGNVDFRTTEDTRHIELYEGSFLTLFDPAHLDAQILHTLFHEYVHFLESWLPLRDQALRARERGEEHRRLGPEEARRLDSQWVARRWALWIGLALLLGGAIALVAVPFALGG